MKIEKAEPGQIVFDVGRHKMGNARVSTVSVWSVKIASIDLEKRTITASWNSNQAKEYMEHAWSKWRVNRPQLIRGAIGNYRLARRNESGAI